MTTKMLDTAQNGAQLLEMRLVDGSGRVVSLQYKVESPHVPGRDVYLGPSQSEARKKFDEACKA